MPCFFCIAVFAMVAGTAIATAIDRLEEKLAKKASGEIKRMADTESVRKLEFKVKVGRKEVPVAVTVYKDHNRVRIQVLSHELTREEVEKLQDEIAEAIDAEVVSRSDPESEEKVQDAEKVEEPEAAKVEAAKSDKERTDRIPR